MADTGQSTSTAATGTTTGRASKTKSSSVNTDTMWTVCDLHATKPRTHSARDPQGKLLQRYVFQVQERKQMPWKHAMCFVPIAGFEVRNEHGKQVRPRSTGNSGQNQTPASLAADEVVANLAELTSEALAKRAQDLPGGSRYNSKSNKDQMVAFIVAGGDENAGPPIETEDGETPGIPEMEPEE